MSYIVAITVDKIQRYIFKNIDEKLSDERTLNEIINSSNKVSEEILNDITSKFKDDIDSMLLCISGKVIFETDLEKQCIRAQLVELFQETYKKYRGNIFIRYVYFEKEDIEGEEDRKIININEASSRLKEEKTKTNIIKDNAELLFRFTEFDRQEKIKEIANRDRGEINNNKKIFIDDMDQLVISDDKHVSESTDGKIAIVKGDINNLGKLMSEIEDYNVFLKISQALEESISIENLMNHIKAYERFNLEGKVLPFYIKGDDIFYAVRIDSVTESVYLLNKIICELNEKIREIYKREKPSGSSHADDNRNFLTLAVGVVFVNNHLPIRYYRQMVEKELSDAKKIMKEPKGKDSLVGIRMEGSLFNIYKGEREISRKDEFADFCEKIEELKKLIGDEVITRTAIHSLLINLDQEKNKRKQLNYLLYFLRHNLENGIKNNEIFNRNICIKDYIISQVLDDNREDKPFEPKNIEKNLIPKLKLMLLLTKDKYNIKQDKSSLKCGSGEKNKGEEIKIDKNKIDNIFYKLLEYIISRSSNDIKSLFIGKEEDKQKIIYKTARFNISIFHRAKRLIESGKGEKIEELFLNYDNIINRPDKNETDSTEGSDKNQESKYKLEFKQEKFKELIKNYTSETDWLDELIIFYHYNQQRILLAKINKNNKKNKAKNSKEKRGKSKKGYKGKSNSKNSNTKKSSERRN